MTIAPRPFPAALPHGELRPVLQNVYMVTGSVRIGGPFRFSRNMMVVREGERLVIVNSVRLSDAGLASLDSLGRVTDVIRVGGFHGMDDPFYKDRYKAKVWAVAGQRYAAGFNPRAGVEYFLADEYVDETSTLPLAGARMVRIPALVPEGVLMLERERGILFTGDSLQNWETADEHFSFVGGLIMRMMGFIKPHQVGPGWLKQAKPKPEDLRALLTQPFENVLPSHGKPVIGGAKAAYTPAIERAAAALG